MASERRVSPTRRFEAWRREGLDRVVIVSRQAFETALAKGSGRAMIQLRQSPGRRDLHEALLAACIRNLAYDPQCESERSPYLSALISATGQQDAFFRALLTALDGAPDQTQPLNLVQIFDVLARLARNHDDLEAGALRRAYCRLDSEEDRLDCLDAMVRIDGLPAFLEGVQALAADLEGNWWRLDDLIEVLRDREGPGVDAVLADLRADNGDLNRLIAHAEAQRSSPAPQPAPYDFDDIRARLQRGVAIANPGRWLHRLTDVQWRALAQDLALQTDDRRATGYLRLFARRDFPDDPRLLLPWAEGPNGPASNFAVIALSRMSSSVVRALALKKLDEGLAHGARLLRWNYEPGDFGRLEDLLASVHDPDGLHDLGLSILDIVARQDDPPEACDVLLTLYDRTPCSRCRSDAVVALEKLQAVPPWMAEECRFDADPDTVGLFQPHAPAPEAATPCSPRP